MPVSVWPCRRSLTPALPSSPARISSSKPVHRSGSRFSDAAVGHRNRSPCRSTANPGYNPEMEENSRPGSQCRQAKCTVAGNFRNTFSARSRGRLGGNECWWAGAILLLPSVPCHVYGSPACFLQYDLILFLTIADYASPSAAMFIRELDDLAINLQSVKRCGTQPDIGNASDIPVWRLAGGRPFTVVPAIFESIAYPPGLKAKYLPSA